MIDTEGNQDIIAALRELSRIGPRDACTKELRSSIDSLPQRVGRSYRAPWVLLRFSQITIAVVLFLMISSIGVVVAASDSRPGDALYPIKKAVEQIELAIANSPPARAILQAKIAGKRADEMQRVVDSQKDGDTLDALSQEYEERVSQTIEELKKATPSSNTVGHDVTEELKKHEQTLETVKTIVPPSHQEPITKAIEASRKGQEAAQAKGDNSQIHGASSSQQDSPPRSSPQNERPDTPSYNPSQGKPDDQSQPQKDEGNNGQDDLPANAKNQKK